MKPSTRPGLPPRDAQTGFSLVELAVTLTILAFLLLAVMPSVGNWIRNTQIRTGAESILQGISKARNEAVRRNARSRFSFVTDLTSGCVLANGALSWIVSLSDPSGECADDISDTASPMIIEKATPGDVATNLLVSIKQPSGTDPCGATDASATFVEFNSYGRMTNSAQLRCISISHSTGSDNRNLNIVIGTGGQIRLCDPAVSSGTDPRKC